MIKVPTFEFLEDPQLICRNGHIVLTRISS